MTATTAESTLPSFAAPRAGRFPLVRLLLAIAITGGALPLGLGISLAFWVMSGRVDPWFFYGALLSGAFLVLICTWGLSREPSIHPWVFPIGLLVFVVWGAATWVLGTMRTNADPTTIAFYGAATLWLPWLAWIGFWPPSWVTRLIILVLLVPLLFVFHQYVKISGLTGDAQLLLAWRTDDDRRELPSLDPNATPPTTTLLAFDTDFPQFLGPWRDATVRGVELNVDWETHPPKELWRKPIGEGWSAFAIVGGLAFTQEQRGDEECVVCYEVKTGNVVWAHKDKVIFESTMGGNGPRATPTIHEGRVYAVGATGRLHCLDAATGAAYWTKELHDDDGTNLLHGACASPLIIGDLVYVCPVSGEDNSLAAYHRISGEQVFSAGGGLASYSSPVYAVIAGVPQILAFKAQAIVGHDAKTGEVLWTFPWGNTSDVNVAQPIALSQDGDRVFISTAYGVGSALLSVSLKDGEWKVDNLWKDLKKRPMNNKFCSSILFEDRFVGLDNGILAAFDAASGKELWKQGRYKHGQVLRVGDDLLVLSEDGDLILVDPAREKKDVQELGRVEGALEGKTWNNLAFAPPYLMIRNSKWAACYELALEGDDADSSPPPEAPKKAKTETVPNETPPRDASGSVTVPAPPTIEPTPDPLPSPPADSDPLPALPLP